MKRVTRLIPAALALAFSLPALSNSQPVTQTHQRDHNQTHNPPPSQPYAGQQQRAIKALSSDEVRAYLDGTGAGFARAAELNRHPGPMHALELAAPLQLTPAQRGALTQLMARHKAEARAFGADVVRLEQELDTIFAAGNPAREAVEIKVAQIGAAQARFRASHLITHIETTHLLTADQIARYDHLRGYAGATSGGGGHHGGAGHGNHSGHAH